MGPAIAIFVMGALAVGVIGAVVAYARKLSVQTRAAWSQAAGQLGMTFTPATTFKTGIIAGTSHGFNVKIDTFSRSSGNNSSTTYTRYVVSGGGIPNSLGVKGQGFFSGLRRAFGGQDIEVGDPAFDSAAIVTGPESLALAVLDDRTRGLLSGILNSLGMRVSEGKVYLERTGVQRDPSQIIAIIQSMLRVAEGVSTNRGSVADLLAQNALSDRVAEVRERNLHQLTARNPTHAQTEHTLRTILDAPPPRNATGVNLVMNRMRLHAASRLGGAASVAELTRIALDSDLPEQVRAEAVDSLGRRSQQTEGIAESLKPLLATALPELTRSVVRALGRLGSGLGSELIPVASLVDMLANAPDDLAVEVATALGKARAVVAVDALVAQLDRDDVPAQVAAANALGQIGDLRAVERLLDLTRGVLRSPALKDAARTAVAAIQEGAKGGGVGQLSVIEPAEGQGGLSVAHDAEGGMAVEESVEVEDAVEVEEVAEVEEASEA